MRRQNSRATDYEVSRVDRDALDMSAAGSALGGLLKRMATMDVVFEVRLA